MASDISGWDEQDQAEVFDEDNFDEDGDFKTLEELPDVLDVTHREGDGDEDEVRDDAEAEGGVLDYEQESDRDKPDRDAYDEIDVDDAPDRDLDDGIEARTSAEVDLEYVPDMDGRRGAQGSARHFESRGVLSDDTLRDLGYAEELQE
jgi:hypothetical protein